ncbi:NAD-dependent epimerase/dehydratase family protein [uncultured Croceitalea sp.]|uniref:NAD-dependent epimerase/dehydratase family protein n=1 Tax=uncultured Croceitalea sp. TaxID=1798908 RepID=UPI00330592A0
MKILVTGAAGFIGFHVIKSLLDSQHTVVGLDNINDYYDINLKYARIKELGIVRKNAEQFNSIVKSKNYTNFRFIRSDIIDDNTLGNLFDKERFDVVCNLAAQAGVRYSLENPKAYVDSNIVGFMNILECCRHYQIKHLVYASSSSVYGMNKKVPFATTDNVNHPISLYAASKKSNELMAHTYSHLYCFRTTGLRFFTVYGPWGRPDMAMFLFTKAILDKKPINVFNKGAMERDFTYIDDIVQGVVRILENKHTSSYDKSKKYNLYNIGNNKSVKLNDFIDAIENELGIVADKNLLPMQPGDVEKTWADVDSLIRDFSYSPNTPIKMGVAEFIKWYKKFYMV